jgi:hypothetical protein
MKINKITFTKELNMPFFPIEFTRKTGNYDFFAPIINFTGNAAVIAGLGGISYVALEALGFSNIATTAGTVIPVAIKITGVVAGVSAVAGAALILFMAKRVADAIGRH